MHAGPGNLLSFCRVGLSRISKSSLVANAARRCLTNDIDEQAAHATISFPTIIIAYTLSITTYCAAAATAACSDAFVSCSDAFVSSSTELSFLSTVLSTATPPPSHRLSLPLAHVSPPPPPSSHATVDAINRRFHRSPESAIWRADGILGDAAVLLHAFDGWEGMLPWAAKGGEGQAADLDGSILMAAQQAAGTGWLETFGMAGIVYRPGHARIKCGCHAECGGHCSEDASRWCPAGGARWQDCQWRPVDFGKVLPHSAELQRRYNEIIIDGSYGLPDAIEAFYFAADRHDSQDGHGVGPQRSQAEAVRAQFIMHYGIRAGTSTNAFPLVELNSRDWQSPFRLA